jgi:2-polyprenyl-6-methoxyphenol hydroxylase-like FAD-dependent oxidoreductase
MKTSGEHQSVLVVGGGPVGLATALALAHRGVSVVVIEKGTWPRDKVCGEGVMPPGVALLHRFGILPHLRCDMLFPFRGIRYCDSMGIVAEADFSHGQGLGIRRTALSTALYQVLAHHPRIALRARTTLIQLIQRTDAVHVCLQQRTPPCTQSRETFACIIGADGLRSTVRALTGLCGPPPGLQQRWGVRQHFAVAPWSPYVEIWWQRGIEAYVTPTGPQQVDVAFLWDRAQFRPQPHQGMTSFLAAFPLLAARLQQARSLSPLRGIGPLAVAAKSPVATRTILVGDALTCLDGITGEGLSMGLAQAELVATNLPPLLRTQRLGQADLQPLSQALQHTTTHYLRMTRLALYLTRHAWLRTGVLRALSRSPRIFQHLLDANMGQRTLWNLPVTAVPALLWGVIAPRRPSTGQRWRW